MRGDFLAVPLFLPGIAAWLLLGLAASGALGRRLGVSRAHAGALILSLGIILSATLTPQLAALRHGALGPGACDLSRMWLAPLRDYLRFGDIGGNVLMFIPLGAALGLLPRSRERAVLILASFLLPFAIELSQLMLLVLDRACQSADVVDNLVGLVLGLAIGLGAVWRSAAGRPGDQPHAGHE